MQWWIETAGKLGPALIAFLLLVTTRAQNRSINAVSLRAAQVEDQKLRLALLERRLEAIDAMREAVAHYQATGQPNAEGRGKLLDALRLAEVVFAEAHEKAISDTIKIGWRMSTLNRRLENPKSEEERGKLIDELVALDGSFEDKSTKLVQTLIDATRMQDVPPLRLPRSKIWNGPFWIASKVRRLGGSSGGDALRRGHGFPGLSGPVYPAFMRAIPRPFVLSPGSLEPGASVT